jgi:hypothetical protein
VIRSVSCNELVSKNFVLNCSKLVVGMGFNNLACWSGGVVGVLATKEFGGMDRYTGK